tara:strand:+ start:393 stop:596 length:204 start_codon:yes stop_codon:yes gene_type:complete
MSINTNSVCKEILDSQEVTSQRIAEVLVTELSAGGYLKKEEVLNLQKKVEKVLSVQTNNLVERVMKL